MGLTEQQESAARAPHSVAVVAGAGTGKTHMLAERYLFHLESGHSPLSIVALTFTKKAAAELRSRIRQTICERLPNSGAIAELEAAQISTFHALATRICQEHPDAAGVPVDFTVLDELDGKVWLAEAFSNALDQIPLLLYEQVPYSLMRAIIYELLSDPLTAEKALKKGREDWFPILGHMREQAIDALLHDIGFQTSCITLGKYSGKLGDKLENMRVDALEAVQLIKNRQHINSCLKALSKLRPDYGSKKNWSSEDDFLKVRSAGETIKALAKASIDKGDITLEPNEWDDQKEAMLPAVREAFEQVRSHLKRAKQRQRVLDFNDLEIHALQALQHQSVREYYAQRWQVFLIDEFQDTNPIQGELLELLTANQLLTIVGDVKQSIYGFRRADVRVFQAWCDRIHTPADPPKKLSLSFRTHHRLIHSINTLFEPVLNGLHQNLDAARQEEPHAAPHLRVLTIQKSDGASIDHGRQAEAQHIAKLIAQMLDDQVMVHDKQTGGILLANPD